MPVPTPSSVRKMQERSKVSAPDSSPSTSGTPEKTLTNAEGRKPRLLVNHPELESIMIRLKEDEEINRKHGWYDRGRNGKKPLPKGTKPNPPRRRTGTSSNGK